MTNSERKRIYAQYEKLLAPFSTSLVAEFRRSADSIGDDLSDEELRWWADEGISLARQSWRSWEAAGDYFRVTPHVLQPLTGEDRAAFLTFAEALASTGWADARSYLEKGPGLLAHIQPMQRGRFLSLSRELARREGRQAFAFFAEAARALSQV